MWFAIFYTWHLVFDVKTSEVRVLCVCFVDRCLSFCTFCFSHCVVYSSSILRILITPLVYSNSSSNPLRFVFDIVVTCLLYYFAFGRYVALLSEKTQWYLRSPLILKLLLWLPKSTYWHSEQSYNCWAASLV